MNRYYSVRIEKIEHHERYIEKKFAAYLSGIVVFRAVRHLLRAGSIRQ